MTKVQKLVMSLVAPTVASKDSRMVGRLAVKTAAKMAELSDRWTAEYWAAKRVVKTGPLSVLKTVAESVKSWELMTEVQMAPWTVEETAGRMGFPWDLMLVGKSVALMEMRMAAMKV